MAFTVPNAVNYSSPLNAVPLDWTSPPVEGAKGIQCTVQWNASQSGANKAVYVNCQNNATLNFSKIRALIIDNSQNGSDIEIIFPDTETSVSIPSYTPYAIIPVFTNQTQFYVVSSLAQATDKTSFTILNTAPPPIAVPTTQEQNFSSSGALNTAASGSQVLIATGNNGTVEAISLNGYTSGSGAASMKTLFTLQDGASNLIWKGVVVGAISTYFNYTLIDLSDLRLRFVNGLTLTWVCSGAVGDGGAAINVYYRTP